MNKYVVRVEAVLDAAREHIEEIAEEYRRKVLIPLCSRHKLEFISGMGMTAFYARDGRSVSADWEAKRERMSYLVPVFEVLNTAALGTNDAFGYYVRDVKESDWR